MRNMEVCKDQESIQSIMTPDQNTIWESDKNTSKHHTKKSQEVSPFLADDHKIARIRHNYNANNKKDPQKMHRFRMVSKIITGGLKHA